MRELEQLLEIFEQPLWLGLRRITHHQIPERIDDIDASSFGERRSNRILEDARKLLTVLVVEPSDQ